MSASRTRWVRLLTTLQWNGINNWNIINDQTIDETIPVLEDWVRKNIAVLSKTHPQETAAFKEYYYPSNKGKTSYNYTLKDRAETALALLHTKERTNGN